MVLTNERDEKILKEAADISVLILKELGSRIRVGNTPLDIDRDAGFLCKEYGVKAAFKRVAGYNFNTCISVNDVAVHGIPKDIPFKEGDLVSIDFGIIHKGMYTDHCWTWSVGEPSKKRRKLLDAGRRGVENAVSKAVVGNRIGDIGYEMESEARRNGFNVLSIFVGHGIGKSLHDIPDIPAFGDRGTGDLLVDGMVICVECQVVDDDDDVEIDRDGWSARTVNGGDSVIFEYMVIVRDGSPTVLTDTFSWGVVV